MQKQGCDVSPPIRAVKELRTSNNKNMPILLNGHVTFTCDTDVRNDLLSPIPIHFGKRVRFHLHCAPSLTSSASARSREYQPMTGTPHTLLGSSTQQHAHNEMTSNATRDKIELHWCCRGLHFSLNVYPTLLITDMMAFFVSSSGTAASVTS